MNSEFVTRQNMNRKKVEGTSLSKFAEEVCRKSSSFPTRKLGSFIKTFKSKALKPYLIDCEGNIDLSEIDTLEQYIKALQKMVTKTGFTIPNEALYSILECAEFWSNLESRYTFDELIIMQLAHIVRTHCVVLYKKDMQPNVETQYNITQISTGYNVRPILVKRR